jgi:RimJ/RimL family protein N-acetyltransferase
MGYAFDEWRVARVDFKSDARNRQSRTAIERLGATFEGVLRHWQPSLVVGEESLCRNTAMYSVIDTEWLDVRAHLRAKLLARS